MLKLKESLRGELRRVRALSLQDVLEQRLKLKIAFATAVRTLKLETVDDPFSKLILVKLSLAGDFRVGTLVAFHTLFHFATGVWALLADDSVARLA